MLAAIPMTRRAFLQAGGLAAFAPAAFGQSAAPRMTAAIIGHTGRGNYGHGLDVVFNGRATIEVLAVADPDEKGRAAAQVRARARRSYADFREMLEKERPQLVVVSPRWTDQRHPMLRAALTAGAHVYCEKPFARSLAEADDVAALAAQKQLRIAVAHQMRLAPQTLLLKRRIDEGLIGELREIRVHGKQDRRAGGEDMVVLATHQFDLVRFFAGDPSWCAARILQDGREITRADARAATENVGPVAGNAIEALFALPDGVSVHYASKAGMAPVAGPWGMEFIGTKGRARLLNDPHTQAFALHASTLTARGETREWRPLSADPKAHAAEGGFPAANGWVIDDWLAAIAEKREPACSGLAALKSLEMIHAVFAAGLSRGRVALPLENRRHPLE